MRSDSFRGSTWIAGIVMAAALGGAGARAGYFANTFAGSPIATFGPAGGYGVSDAGSLTSETFYTDGVNVFSSEGYSAASLATGSLHSLASANYGYVPDAIASTITPTSFQFGNSSFGDSLTFLGNFTGQQATFQISIDGTWSGSLSGFNGSDFQFLVLPSGTIDANAGNTLNLFNNPDINNIAIANVTDPLGPSTTSPLTFDVPVTLNGLNPTIDFAANLNIATFANLGDNFSADYSDTATVGIAGPTGVTIISASGVFPGTVPEPTSISLAVAGLTGLGLIARRRAGRVVR
jgi:hypothetical protein